MNLLDRINTILNEVQRVEERAGDGEEYEKFFKKKLKKWKIKSPDELSRKERKKFFKEVEDDWIKENPATNDGDR